jgi:hypothetical protein
VSPVLFSVSFGLSNKYSTVLGYMTLLVSTGTLEYDLGSSTTGQGPVMILCDLQQTGLGRKVHQDGADRLVVVDGRTFADSCL